MSVAGPRSHRYRAFTVVELLVAVFVIIVLATILLPYVEKLREADRRAQCNRNLSQIRDALHRYAAENRFDYPRVVYDAVHQPNSYTCFSGPDATNPFVPDGAVHANDVTASLWLLIRNGLLQDPRVFICPSSGDQRDTLTDRAGRWVKTLDRSNFRAGANLSYGYSTPFSNAPRYTMNDTRLGDFAIVADKGPPRDRGPLVGPSSSAPPLQFKALNSRNHQGAGQNVLFADGSVRFERTPYCGVGRSNVAGGDNIYSALTAKPLNGETPPADGVGYWSPTIGPAWESDSYIVPIEGGETPR